MPDITWATRVELDRAGQAERYLTLFYGPDVARRLSRRFKGAPFVEQRAKDLLRAAREKPVKKGDTGLKEEQDRIDRGEPLAPALIVVGGGKPIIAEGYRRICAAYLQDQDTIVPCILVEVLPGGPE